MNTIIQRFLPEVVGFMVGCIIALAFLLLAGCGDNTSVDTTSTWCRISLTQTFDLLHITMETSCKPGTDYLIGYSVSSGSNIVSSGVAKACPQAWIQNTVFVPINDRTVDTYTAAAVMSTSSADDTEDVWCHASAELASKDIY